MARIELGRQSESAGSACILARAPVRPLALALATTLSACTIVNIRDGSGVRTSYYPGVAVIRVTPADAVQVLEVESAGTSVVGNQFHLGWSHSRLALVPPGRCQFIEWEANAARLTALRRIFGERAEWCSEEGDSK
jgi:hypothetical protein